MFSLFEVVCASAFNAGNEKKKKENRVQGLFCDYCITAIWYDKMKPQDIFQVRWICTMIFVYLWNRQGYGSTLHSSRVGVLQSPQPGAAAFTGWIKGRQLHADCFMQLSLECYFAVNIKERSFALGCTVGGPVQLWPRGCCSHGAVLAGSMLGHKAPDRAGGFTQAAHPALLHNWL